MIEVGHYCLFLAFALSIGQFYFVFANNNKVNWLPTIQTITLLQAVLMVISFGCLMDAFITSDFSVKNVFQNSHTTKPLFYKITAVWGNHEGSLLLWTMILSLYSAVFSLFAKSFTSSEKRYILCFQGIILLFFLSFLIFASSPFTRLFPPPYNGNGFNPLLQDVILAIHPPFLYIGLIGFSLPFSALLASLLKGQINKDWFQKMRPWCMWAWSMLTTGIILGSWWAYHELGWGGWWFWDPVENASVMPWLLSTALIHSMIASQKSGLFYRWSTLLVIMTFAFVLLSFFLVRSGILTSVHSFAMDPEKGFLVFLILTITVGGALIIYGLKAPNIKAAHLQGVISREGSILVNNIFLSVITATVFLGTLYPLFLEFISDKQISVGSAYYNKVIGILIIIPLFAMGAASYLSWNKVKSSFLLRKLSVIFLLTVLCLGILLYQNGFESILGLFALSLVFWVMGCVIFEFLDKISFARVSVSSSWEKSKKLPLSSYIMRLAHIGFCLMLIGMIGSSLWEKNTLTTVKLGQSLSKGDYQYHFENLNREMKENYLSERATFQIKKNGQFIHQAFPEKRFYPIRKMTTSEPSIIRDGLSDHYISLGEGQKDQEYQVRVYYKPLIYLIWLGCLIMIISGLLSCYRLCQQRYRRNIEQEQR